MKVKTDFTGSDYITPGKVYDAEPEGDEAFTARLDHGEKAYCLINNCSHLNGGNWTIVEQAPAEKEGGK